MDYPSLSTGCAGICCYQASALSPKEVAELLKTPIIGVLPEEDSIYEGDLGEIHPSFKLIAGNLLTGRKKLYDVTKKYSGFWGNVRRALKKRL